MGDLWRGKHGNAYKPAEVRPVFRNVERELVKEIRKSDIVVGCVAWLTSIPILEALQSTKCQFVVQVEDWLRPDSGDSPYDDIRQLIKTLSPISNYDTDQMLSMGTCMDISPVRLSGSPARKNRTHPRMHHKFAIFGNYVEPTETDVDNCVDPHTFHTVWTGSYNWTRNATRSLENGLFIRSADVVEAYRREWFEVLLTSERIEDGWWLGYGWDADDDYLREGT